MMFSTLQPEFSHNSAALVQQLLNAPIWSVKQHPLPQFCRKIAPNIRHFQIARAPPPEWSARPSSRPLIYLIYSSFIPSSL